MDKQIITEEEKDRLLSFLSSWQISDRYRLSTMRRLKGYIKASPRLIQETVGQDGAHLFKHAQMARIKLAVLDALKKGVSVDQIEEMINHRVDEFNTLIEANLYA